MKKPFFINDFLVEPDLNRITSPEGKQEKLEPKWMAVLCVLAINKGEVVSKQELMVAVWENTIVVEKVLIRAISKLRKAFNDDPRHPKIIETVSKGGYRMIGTLRYQQEASGSRLFSLQKALPFFLLLTIIFVFFFRNDHPFKKEIQHPKITPLTTFHSWEYDPAISPDGKLLAFVWNGINKKGWNIRSDNSKSWDIFIKNLETGKLVHFTQMKGSEGSPVWSADGAHLIFYNQQNDTATLYMKALDAGKPARRLTSFLANYPTLSWSKDGKWLAYNAKDSTNTPNAIQRLSLVTLESQQISFPPEHTWGDYQPSFSHDGKTLAFTQARSESLSDIFLLDLQNKQVEQLTFQGANFFSHAWRKNDKTLLYSLNTNGHSEIWEIDLATKHAKKIIGETGLTNPQLSGTKMVVEKWTNTTDIWRLNLAGDSASNKAEPFIQSTAWDAHPAFSPDGNQIAFASNRSGSYEIWITDKFGSASQKITNFKSGFCGTPHWSPNGQQITFDWRSKGQSDIYLIDLKTKQLIQLTSHAKDDIAPFFTADAKAICYSSNRKGYWQIWKQDLKTDTAKAITGAHVYALQFAHQDDSFYQSYHNQSGIWQQFTGKDSLVQIIDGLEPADWCNWVVAERGIYFVQRVEGRNNDFIAFYDLGTKKINKVYHPKYQIPSKDLSLALSPDGKTLLFGQVENAGCDLQLVEF